MKNLTERELKRLFAQHIVKFLGFPEAEAVAAIDDFPDPAVNIYLKEELAGKYSFDGIDYNKFYCCADLECLKANVPPFEFYVLKSTDNRSKPLYLKD